jgi:hypothetical protein
MVKELKLCNKCLTKLKDAQMNVFVVKGFGTDLNSCDECKKTKQEVATVHFESTGNFGKPEQTGTGKSMYDNN